MSSAWANIAKPEPVNLQDIMSEQVAADLAKKEEEKFLQHLNYDISHEDIQQATDRGIYDIPGEVFSESVASDTEIARMLQAQYDREHDEQLKRNQDKFNGASKVSISYKNYMRSTCDGASEGEEEEEIEDICDKKDWDRFDAMERELCSMPTCGYKVKNGNIITKHDTVMSGRKNACKLLMFPPEFQTGDGENFDLKLSNKVYNSLKIYSQNEQSRRHKIRDKKEDQATAVFGLDQHTTLILLKMINNQLLECFNGVINIGKEAVILVADGCPTCEKVKVPKDCVIKVFKTTLSEFKQREKYIRDDHRFKDRIGKQTSRKTVHIWAEKEMANLYRLKRAGIPCPDVVMLKEHVLVMSFIGENGVPARKLKEAAMDAADYIIAYDQVVNMMKILFTDANLIHADLSEYNILWHNGQCYLIDVSQAVEPIHENAFHFLLRDCNNISNFFGRKLVPKVATADELFESITGYNFQNKEQLLRLHKTAKPKPHTIDALHEEAVDNFQQIWESFGSIVKSESVLVQPPHA